jgi:predicted outer membrane repeat protein
MKSAKSVLVGGLGLMAAAGTATAADLLVPSQFSTIQGAIDAAVNGDTIIVSPGTYRESLRFAGTGGTISKDITVRGSGGPAVTIIDRTGLPQETAVVIANLGSSSIVPINATFEGFTVLRGTIAGTNGRGGGAVIGGNSGLIVIRNCVFEACKAQGRGAAISVSNASALIENTVFLNNDASPTATGGALSFSGTNTDPTVTGTIVNQCTFTGNFAEGGGGAVHVQDIQRPIIRNSTFTGNFTTSAAAYAGGAFNLTGSSSTTLEQCVISGNFSSLGSGGAIHVSQGANAMIQNNVFTGNQARRANGGAIQVAQDAAAGTPLSTATIRGNRFVGNTADSAGGAITVGSTTINGTLTTPIEISNNIITGNTTGGRTGGPNGNANAIIILSGAAGNPVIIANNTIVGNRGLTGAGSASGTSVWNINGVPVTFANNILRLNLTDANGPLIATGGVGITATYNNIQGLATAQGGLWAGAPGNFDSPPLFTDADGADNIAFNGDDDYSLAAGSPGIDAGSNAAVPAGLLTDFAGNGRFQDDPAVTDSGLGTAPIVDVGAYEAPGTPDCPADFNGDGFLDFFDYDDFVACFEGVVCPGNDPNAADFNNDGFVDFFDYDDFVLAFEVGC